ncbi:5'-methylthioadenosine/adenosylhomocysteine nucleosidase [Streptobacillus moniliformis]|uniref:5'-methylthioadenosine/adenosylhomocysteine nucleosidase n=1 Tax=Streptobacillus moniliformis TaxID=34105 RepID=UPI0009BCB2EA|nr:5'-methylthioadenosine/adenosylhomocysteine nucleosidase [Streptobacillus moniliformis]
MIGIIGAMHEEINVIKQEMENIEIEIVNGNTFYIGLLNNKKVILVGCGIGMVNAAIVTTLLINEFKVKKIYFSGVAGSTSNKLKIGDIVISTELQEYLFDTTEFGYEMGIIPRMEPSIFKPREILEDAMNKLKGEKIHFGKIVSGDKFVSNADEKIKIGENFKALCVDMESASVAHCSYLLGVDFLIIRSISDTLSDESTMEFEKFVNLAAENSKNILTKLI